MFPPPGVHPDLTAPATLAVAHEQRPAAQVKPCVERVDTSAWWWFSSLPSELIDKAIFDDRLWITPIIRMEILYSARSSAEYIAFGMGLDGFRILRNDLAVADTRGS